MKRIFKSLPALAVIVLAVIILIPIPVPLLDTLMFVNLAFALLLLLIARFSKNIKEFVLLPSLILLSTVFNLAINLSAVRLILTQGSYFNGRLIGLISLPLSNTGLIGHTIGYSFIILPISVLAVIITRGGSHASEIAVRFTQDSMNVKLMAIETEFSSGKINDEEATLRKQKVQQDADFFGSMDGASKFVSGNAKLTIFLSVFVILAGILLEYFLRDSSIKDVISLYLGFSAGICLLFILQPIILSTVMGIVVTREASKT